MTIDNENDLIAQRRQDLKEMRKAGNAYSNKFKRDSLSSDLHAEYESKSKEELENASIMGKASFAHIQDMTGKIQLYVRRDDLSDGIYNDGFKKWDIGDIVGAIGTVMKTNKGELSIHVNSIELLTKSLQPLPEKYHGLTDQELRYRQRYVDLIMNEQTREIFKIRSKVVEFLRSFFKNENYIEVETPMMHTIPGGATARPFITHHNSLDMELFLRIAPELYLKRLVVGGFERVFEINRSFRNEGLSPKHNPEFTMLEFYQAFSDYEDLMDLTEKMMRELSSTLLGTNEVTYQDHVYDLGKSFERLTVLESILKYNKDITNSDLDSLEKIRNIARELDISLEDNYGLGKIQIEIFEKTVESKLLSPTFVTHFPTEVSPLARMNSDNPFVTDRFEFFIAGREIANGFSELNDPEDQAERFKKQVEEKNAGDAEAMHFDDDYIKALEYGMPPTAGEGIGIDRLVMFLTDSASIRDVILFPHMRQK